MYVRKNKSSYNSDTNRIFLDCIYAEENMFRDFMELDKHVRNELAAKISSEPDAFILLDMNAGEKVEWVSLEDFIEIAGVSR